jgi:hypothetical protein
MKVGILERLEAFDPGLVRTRRGTMVAVTSVAGVGEPLPITLFGAGACFQSALLATDPQRTARFRPLCWARSGLGCGRCLATNSSAWTRP